MGLISRSGQTKDLKTGSLFIAFCLTFSIKGLANVEFSPCVVDG